MDVIVISDDEPAGPSIGASKTRHRQLQQLSSEDEDFTPKAKPARKRAPKQAAQDIPHAYNELDGGPKKKAKKQPKQEKEKRTDEAGNTVTFRKAPSQQVSERMQRALPGSAHRMFLISTRQLAAAGAPGARAQEFVVLGATGNVYTVRISKQPRCDCPDAAKGHVCKHILFVYLRVLKLSASNPIVWQKALLTHEVEGVLSGAHSQGVAHLQGVLADVDVRSAYEQATGERAAAPAGAAAAAAGSGGVARKPVEGDCPICFSELKEGEEPLVWCQSSCGNNVHKLCCDKWAAAKRRSGQPVTCVYCRSSWPGSQAPDGAAAASAAGYLNLANHSAQHAHANTSLYSLYGESASWILHHQGYGGGGRHMANRARANAPTGRRRH